MAMGFKCYLFIIVFCANGYICKQEVNKFIYLFDAVVLLFVNPKEQFTTFPFRSNVCRTELSDYIAKITILQ